MVSLNSGFFTAAKILFTVPNQLFFIVLSYVLLFAIYISVYPERIYSLRIKQIHKFEYQSVVVLYSRECNILYSIMS